MKITICGSVAFLDEMHELEHKLTEMGHEVQVPFVELVNEKGDSISIKEYYAIRKDPTRHANWVWREKGKAIRNHFEKVDWADVILVANYTKHTIEHYIGANTLIEMGIAFYFKKPIFLLNPVPSMAYREEILGMQPKLLNGNLTKIV